MLCRLYTKIIIIVFVFAFGLENDQEFIKHLLSKNILKTKDVATLSDLVFYEDDSGLITHGGTMQSEDRVISKWMWGPIIEHDLLEVPSSFGDKIFFCDSCEPKIIKGEYEKYRDSGVNIKPIN